MIRAAADRFRVLTWREISAHGVRSAALVVVLGVAAALLVAVVTAYSSLIGSAGELNRSIAGDADLAVLGYTDTGFDMSLCTVAAEVPGVRAAVPLIQSTVSASGPVAVLGVDPSVVRLRSPLQDALMSQLRVDPGLLGAADRVVVGAQMNLAPGQSFPLRHKTLTVAAVVPAETAAQINGGHFVAAPLRTAQALTERPDRVDAVFIVAEPGVDTAALRDRIAAAIGDRALVTGSDLRSAQVRNALLLVRSITLLVAAVSLVVAAFLMFNATNMAVAQRRRTIAMLRAVGARRRVLVADLLVEAVLFGLAAATIGIPLGLLLARWAVGRTPAFLLDVVSARLHFQVTPLVFPAVIGLCVAASVAATLVAAHQVSRIEPTEALRTANIGPGEPIPARTAITAGIGALAATALTAVIALRVSNLFVVAAVGVLTAGLLALGLAMARAVVGVAAWISRWSGSPGRMAAASIHRAPRRTWATAMTVGIAVTIGIAVNGALGDLVRSAGSTFDPLRRTDLLVTAAGEDGFPSGLLPAHWEQQVRRTPGVADVAGAQWAHVTVDEARVQIAGMAPGNGNIADLLDPGIRADVLAGRGIVVSRSLADRLATEVGDEIVLGTPTGPHSVRILGEFGYLSVEAGVIGMSLETMRIWFDRPGSSYLAVTVAGEVAPVRAALQTALGPDAKLSTGEDAYRFSLFNIDQAGVFAVGLQWIVALLAAFAVMNTLLLAVVQRRREIGVLRAMGASRRLVARLVVIEAVAVGLVGGAMGVLGGEAVHLLAVRVLAVLTGIDVRYALNPAALWSAVIALGVCLAGAVPPAIRASRLNVIAAVAAD
ncbi:ABC transporter permease [Nocardia goodfellowii]|uniref:ABC transport system permease protein n=1 Tax=Nocardia goodfellowii TaxID=882446 RepID=A0ABS4QIL7_9NOCA|nr:FtsX-like permease family protein [Nocardia goodfellowii]MBP2191535.1 putative ABC transport system permease protein [Nocardia goodfellowii]